MALGVDELLDNLDVGVALPAAAAVVVVITFDAPTDPFAAGEGVDNDEALAATFVTEATAETEAAEEEVELGTL